MSFKISETLTSLKDQINKEPMIVLEIENSKYLYGTAPILVKARWDDPRIKWDNEEGVTWDGFIEKDNSKPYIMTKGSKTTKSFSSQLIVEKGGAGSIPPMEIELVDYRGEVAEDLSFNSIGDPLGNKATVWTGLQGGSFPEDFFKLTSGYIDDIIYNAGSIVVSTILSTNLVRQSSFEQYQGETTIAIDSLVTTIPVLTSGLLLDSQDTFTSYIRIDDEIMEVLSFTPTAIEVQRGTLGTIASAHDEETEILSNHYLAGHPIDLALKLLHSKSGNEYKDQSINISALNRVNNTTVIDGAIIVDDLDIEATLGLVPGDLIDLVGTSFDGIKVVTGFGTLITGKSYILVNDTMGEETSLVTSLRTKSQFNVLPDGVGLDIDFVDTEAFLDVKDLYSSNFIDYDLPLLSTIENTRDWIIDNVFRPQGIYILARKAKTSCKYTAPPFSAEQIPTLNSDTTHKMGGVVMQRSTHKYLYNSILYRYNQGTLEEKFFAKNLLISADSLNRIPVGRQRLEINAIGLDNSPTNIQVIERTSVQILNRFKFGPRYIKNIRPLYSVGMTLELGDIVFFGGEDTKLVNLETGARDNPIAQYEIVGKNQDLIAGDVILTLLETGFGIDGVFGVFSPSSFLATGSDTTRILLNELWDSSQFEEERDKWTRWIGLKIRVRSEDYSYDETTTITALDPATINGLLIEELPSAPLEGYTVELAKYEEYTEEELELMAKLTYTFTMPSSLITGVTDDKTFDVADISNIFIGMEVNVHAGDYSTDSELRIIDDIVGNTITLESDLDFTPTIGERLEVYAYSDAKGYRYL